MHVGCCINSENVYTRPCRKMPFNSTVLQKLYSRKRKSMHACPQEQRFALFLKSAERRLHGHMTHLDCGCCTFSCHRPFLSSTRVHTLTTAACKQPSVYLFTPKAKGRTEGHWRRGVIFWTHTDIQIGVQVWQYFASTPSPKITPARTSFDLWPSHFTDL